MDRFQCAYCRHIYKAEAQAEKCKCEGAKAVRTNGGQTPAVKVQLKGLTAADAAPVEPEAVAEPEREPVEATP
jgi:hypothetical protein